VETAAPRSWVGKTILVVDGPHGRSLSVMSLAHLRIVKLARSLSPGGAPAAKTTAPAASYCGATREPIYRTVDEATESGLELCDACVADFRKQRKSQ